MWLHSPRCWASQPQSPATWSRVIDFLAYRIKSLEMLHKQERRRGSAEKSIKLWYAATNRRADRNSLINTAKHLNCVSEPNILPPITKKLCSKLAMTQEARCGHSERAER